MKTECPVCGHPRNRANEGAGARVKCQVCRTTFSVRHVVSEEEQQQAAEQRSKFIGTVLPIGLFSFVLLCAVCAEVLHARANPTPVVADSTPGETASGMPAQTAPEQVIPGSTTAVPRTSAGQQGTNSTSGRSQALTSTNRTLTPNGAARRGAVVNGHTWSPDAGDSSPSSGSSNRNVTPVALADSGREPSSVDFPNDPRDLPVLSPPATRLQLARRGTSLVTLTEDATAALLWESPNLTRRMFSGQSDVRANIGVAAASCLSGKDDSLVVGTRRGEIIAYESGESFRLPFRHSAELLAVSFDGHDYHSVAVDGTVTSQRPGLSYARWSQLPVKVISTGTDSESVVFGCEDGTVMRARVSTVRFWTGCRVGFPPHCVDVASDHIAVAGGQRAEVRHARSFDVLQTFALPFQASAVALSRDGRMLAVGGVDGAVVAYNIYSRRVLGVHKLAAAPVDLGFYDAAAVPEIRVAAADGSLHRIELDPTNFSRDELQLEIRKPLAYRGGPTLHPALTAYSTGEMRAAFAASHDTIKEMIFQTGRQTRRIQYLKRLNAERVAVFGSALEDARRAVLVTGGLITDLEIVEAKSGHLQLAWSVSEREAPVIVIQFDDEQLVTIPCSAVEAGPNAASKFRDDEALFMPPEQRADSLDDSFAMLLLPPRTGIYSQISGRGTIIAQDGATLPSQIRGRITVVRTTSIRPPEGLDVEGRRDFVSERLSINPIPPINFDTAAP